MKQCIDRKHPAYNERAEIGLERRRFACNERVAFKRSVLRHTSETLTNDIRYRKLSAGLQGYTFHHS